LIRGREENLLEGERGGWIRRGQAWHARVRLVCRVELLLYHQVPALGLPGSGSRFFPSVVGLGPGRADLRFKASSRLNGRFFYFLFFFTKIYFRFGNSQEYTPAAPLAALQRGGRGIFEKNFAEKIVRRSLGAVARQQGGRPWPPGCRATGSPTLI